MNVRTTSRLAWSLWGVAVALAGLHLALLSLNGVRYGADVLIDDLRVVLSTGTLDLLATVTSATLGALIVTRRHGHRVGWLVLSTALGGIATWVGDDLAVRALVVGASSELSAGWASLASDLANVVWIGSLLLVLWLFPSGRLLSPRWRPLLATTLAALAVWALALALIPGPRPSEWRVVENPMGVQLFQALSGWVESIIPAAAAVAALSALAALVSRFRSSRGAERTQQKWLVYAGAVSFLAFTVTVPLGPSNPWVDLGSKVIFQVGMPVAVAIAILRHHLYDIDRIISRTLAYALVTALLAGAYLGLVLLLGAVLRPITAGSDLTVAGSVLVVAALFNPVRRRVQALLDRRFNRARYDAQQTITAFSERLRQEVDLETLTGELTDVVEETMQPERVELWVPPR